MEPKHLYNCIAKEYDEWYGDEISIIQNNFLFNILEKEEFFNGKILDIGCGTGLLLEYKKLNPKNYLGIDCSDKMCNIARKKFPEYNFLETSFEDLELNDDGYDNLISLFGPLSYIKDDNIIAKRTRELLKSGGRFFYIFYNTEIYLPSFEKELNLKLPIRGFKSIKNLFKDFNVSIVGFVYKDIKLQEKFALDYYNFENKVIGVVKPDLCNYIIVKGSI